MKREVSSRFLELILAACIFMLPLSRRVITSSANVSTTRWSRVDSIKKKKKKRGAGSGDRIFPRSSTRFVTRYSFARRTNCSDFNEGAVAFRSSVNRDNHAFRNQFRELLYTSRSRYSQAFVSENGGKFRTRGRVLPTPGIIYAAAN